MTTFLLCAPTARTSLTSTTIARAMVSRACLFSTKAVTTRSASTAKAAVAASFQRTTSSNNDSRGLLTLLGVAASVAHPVVVTLCEKKKDNDDIWSRDGNGNIDWKAVLDNVTTMTGEKVGMLHV
jgi:hypothetical protein